MLQGVAMRCIGVAERIHVLIPLVDWGIMPVLYAMQENVGRSILRTSMRAAVSRIGLMQEIEGGKDMRLSNDCAAEWRTRTYYNSALLVRIYIYYKN